MKMMLLVTFLSACIPFKKEPRVEQYVSRARPVVVSPAPKPISTDIENQLNRELAWNEISLEAIESYSKINSLINKKCASCHDSDKPLPFYGRIFQQRNIFKKHRDDGLDNVDFALKFPLKAKGNPPQLSILKAVRTSIVERTMPIKLYKIFYPARRITDKDEEAILGWIDPLIERIEDFNETYNRPVDNSVEERVKNIFAYSCNRCHGNGNNRGEFGGMEDLEKLSKSKYVNKESPEDSELYFYIKNGEMPPSKLERLSDEEIEVVLEWIRGLD